MNMVAGHGLGWAWPVVQAGTEAVPRWALK